MALHSVAPWFLGGLIYLGWRSDRLLLFSWLSGLGFNYDDLRDAAEVIRLPEAVIHSLPGGLWAYSFSWSLAVVWRTDHSRDRGLWLALPWGVAVGSEFCQLVKILPGTFDRVDLAFYVAGCIWGPSLARSTTMLGEEGRHATQTPVGSHLTGILDSCCRVE